MSGAGFLGKVRSAFRKQPADWDLSDTASFDFSHDRTEDDDDTPTFKTLRVVVSGDIDSTTGAPANGAQVNTVVDDDVSLLDCSSSFDPCATCTQKKETLKRNRVMKKLAFAAALYFLFMIGELVGGYMANSLAIMTDALHILTDLVGIGASLLALWLSAKPPTKTFTFGLHRLEVVSAAISVLLVYILTAALLNEAVQRTVHQDFDINGDVMLITAAVGVAVNLIMGFLLNQSGHVHSHSHHGAGVHTGRGRSQGHGSLAVRAAFVHALGDLVQSVGVLIAAYVVRFKPEYKIADPICTYIFSVLVLCTTVKIVRDTGIIVLEGVPRHLDITRIREDLLKLDDVHSVEDLNVWALAPDKTAALVHLYLVPSGSSDWEEVQAKARQLLLSVYGIHRSTIQLQCYREESPSSCAGCRALTS